MLVLVGLPWAEKVNAGVGGVILVGKGKRTVANVFTKTRQGGKTKKHTERPESCMSLLRLIGNCGPRKFHPVQSVADLRFESWPPSKRVHLWVSGKWRRVIVVQCDPTFVAIIRSDPHLVMPGVSDFPTDVDGDSSKAGCASRPGLSSPFTSES
jgi:hypothetical protein